MASLTRGSGPLAAGREADFFSTIWCGSRSVCSGAWSRMTNRATGTVNSANRAAKASSVSCQPTALMAKVSVGVIRAMPAMDPVDRKNSAMPRWRVNQRLMTGVSATGLVKARPTDRATPKASRNSMGPRAKTVQMDEATTMAAPVSSTKRVPRVLTR